MRTTSTFPQAAPRLCLEHGIDEADTDCLHVEERGATFESPWHFEPLAELMLCLAWSHPRLGKRRTPLTGVVVDSRKLTDGWYETIVLFSDLHGDQRARVREFARMVR